MRKLILGCGYLGRRVARLWQAQGDAVMALTRGRATELSALNIEPILGDVRTISELPPAETVLYAVAPDRRTGATPEEAWGQGLENVLRCVTAWPPTVRFLFVSSTGVYGQEGGVEVQESSPCEPQEESGRAIRAAEQRLLRDIPERAIILRFAGIYGPGRLMRAQGLIQGEPVPAAPNKWLNLIHVEDGARAILAAEKCGKPGEIYNISDGHPVLRREFYGELARLLNAPAPQFAAPTPGAGGRHDRADRRVLNHRLRSELGFTPQYPSYREGLAASLTQNEVSS